MGNKCIIISTRIYTRQAVGTKKSGEREREKINFMTQPIKKTFKKALKPDWLVGRI